MANLLYRRATDILVRLCNRGVLQRKAEIVGIRISDPLAIRRQTRQPKEEFAQCGDDMQLRGFAQGPASAQVELCSKMVLESNRLLDMKLRKVLAFVKFS